jgi:adenosine deaminase
MPITLNRLAFALACAAAAPAVLAKGPVANKANEAATARHYAALVAGEPKRAELTLFFSQMPKGGDLHHHYSGSLYAEQYLDWIDQNGYCVNIHTYRIEMDKAVVAAQRAKAPAERSCLGTAEILADDFTYREMLQRWSSKDFHNHGAIQSPPDRQFFQTFLYFDPVSRGNFAEGLQELKKRAIEENVGYIETMLKSGPNRSNPDFDAKVRAAPDDAALEAVLGDWTATLEHDEAYNKSLTDFMDRIESVHAGIDSEQFTMRYQVYALRLLPPSLVYSSMLNGFRAAASNGLVVGVNIVGQESQAVSMRDYTLHMKMFRFLKRHYPGVKLALHAGELALGDVPPSGLQFHIDEAIAVGGADRIGHGIDLAHERNAPAIMKTMRERKIPVEINLTSNAFISGIEGDNHPITLYRKYGVPYVISTDDSGVTRHNLANEYVLFASRYKPSYAEVKKVSYDSLRFSFLQPADKARLLAQLDARYAKFEAAVASQASAARR